ncbi:MAG: hypothetical protein R2734_03970 [Nocardioides sp.]
MTLLWVLALAAGIVVVAVASRRAVGAALEVADGLGVAVGVVGVSVLAIGTDLPEIANSLIASVSGHGDLNVGDSTGSALTQVTLVLALLVLAAGLTGESGREEWPVVVLAGALCVVALGVLALLISDGFLGRLDGLLLVVGWVFGMWWLERRSRAAEQPRPRPSAAVSGGVARTLLWLGLVGASATVIVESFLQLTEVLGVPEFVASSIVLALGTSLPELVVSWTAIRRGAAALAIGDLFGSSLADSTLSVGTGPVVHGTPVSSEAVLGTLVCAGGVAVATLVVAMVRRRRGLAGALLATYVAGIAGLALVAG